MQVISSSAPARRKNAPSNVGTVLLSGSTEKPGSREMKYDVSGPAVQGEEGRTGVVSTGAGGAASTTAST